jgi:hypothetical protein
MLARLVIGSAIGLAAAATAMPAQAVEPSGTAVAVLRNTAANGPGGDRTLETQGPVFSGDVVKTDQRGTAQIVFADETRMVIGPESQVTIDKFVFHGPAKPGTFAINALRGSFRFITGVSAKNAYSIATPTATIGVRGTAFDGYVDKDGTTTLMMWHGTVHICDKGEPRRRCTDISGACTVIQLDPQKRFNWVNDIYKRTDLIDRDVPFAFRQGLLKSDFRVASAGCDVRELNPPNPNSHGGGPPPAPQREK